MGYHSLNSNKEQLIRYKQVSHLRKVDVICQIKRIHGTCSTCGSRSRRSHADEKTREINEEENLHVKETTANYRNTERGKHDKNSKGIYYSNGNYEAFARPEKPEGVDDKHAYIVGSGLASLAAACFLVRDAQMPGDHIHILEAMDIAGGACDGIFDPSRGYIMRGGREMENHFECLWDLFRSIPSLENRVLLFWTSSTG